MTYYIWIIFYALMVLFVSWGASARPLVVGSKKFTESVILGEIARLSLKHDGFEVRHKGELGGTRILWNALIAGDIDVYPEYTGTISREILQEEIGSIEELQDKLKEFGIGVLPPFGFNNTYAIGVPKALAIELNLKNVSDLVRYPDLKIGWGEEFRLRQDGWPGLRKRYGLPHKFVRGMDHDIAYRALQNGDIQVTDLYSTDAEIAYYNLAILNDNLNFFPSYEALFLYRLEQAEKSRKFLPALARLSGKISDSQMIEMNRQVKLVKRPTREVVAEFLEKTFGWKVKYRVVTRAERLWQRTKEHLLLVFFSLLFAIMAGVPLGIFAEKLPTVGRGILWTVGIIQTIPALALLVVLIRPLNLIGLSGIGDTPAFIALFLYSLLPIVRSTHTGFQQISFVLRETASVLGLSRWRRLCRIEIPLALPSIISGIKTAAVMNVGFATLGALVGAGGYGQPILTGIRLDNYSLILEGALPAAVFALIAQQFFDFIEGKIVSPGLRA